MSWLEALILGIVQGLTEFLPVSSSGHIELGKAIFGIHEADSITFTIVVHLATVTSIITVFWKDIVQLVKSAFTFQKNEDNMFSIKLIISAIPVAILGFTLADKIEQLFTGNAIIVSIFLLLTGLILIFAHFAKEKNKPLSFWDSLIIGIAQAIAVLPGISRSGATISTALILGNNKKEAARFSFLMVIIPILGIAAKDLYSNITNNSFISEIGFLPLLIGFISSYIVGFIACKWMIKLVQNSKLIYFAIYCFIVALTAFLLVLFK